MDKPETIAEIRNELSEMEPRDFYYKHIMKSHNWYLSCYLNLSNDKLIDATDSFKEIVTSGLGINFHSVQIVGSAKTGFSLSPNKLLKPFHEESEGQKASDIDIAVVSEGMYNSYWRKLRGIKKIWFEPYYDQITKSMFRGYINERNIKNIDGLREEWEEMIGPVNIKLQDKVGFIHPISYRLYRSWDDLEEYQIIAIAKAKKQLEEI